MLLSSNTDSIFFPTLLQELDYGTIMCWADNVVGQQKEPCVFHLIAAGKPEMPYNCSLVNQTSESLEVDCAEGNYFTIICLSPACRPMRSSNGAVPGSTIHQPPERSLLISCPYRCYLNCRPTTTSPSLMYGRFAYIFISR